MGLLSPSIKERWTTFRSVVIRPWWWVVGIVWLIVSGIDTAKGELIPDRWAGAPRLVNLLPGWPWWVWALIGLSLLWLLTLEGAHRALRKWRTEAMTLGFSAPIPMAEISTKLFSIVALQHWFHDTRLGVELNITAIPAMQVERLYIDIGGKLGESEWQSSMVDGSWDRYTLYFEIPKGIKGLHTARIVAVVDGVSQSPSAPIQVSVP